REAREKVPGVDRGGLLVPSTGSQRAEPADVDVDRVVEARAGRIRVEAFADGAGPDRRQGAPQRAARALLVRFWPEQCSEPLPWLAATLECEERKDRGRLARVEGDLATAALDARSAEERDAQTGARSRGLPAGHAATVTFPGRC